MATVINNPPASSNTSGNGMGFLLGAIVLVVFFFLLLYYGLPALQKGMSGGVQVNVPKNVNVKVQQQGGGNGTY